MDRQSVVKNIRGKHHFLGSFVRNCVLASTIFSDLDIMSPQNDMSNIETDSELVKQGMEN